MKAIIVLLALIALTQATWVNQTQTRFMRDGKRTYFSLPMVPVSADQTYTLSMTLKFADIYDMYTVSFDAVPSDIDSPNVIVKEKGQVDTVVLQTATGAKQGWSADGLECGLFDGYVESDTPVSSIAVALSFDGVPSFEIPERMCFRKIFFFFYSYSASIDCPAFGMNQMSTNVGFVFLIILSIVLAFGLFCCCVACRRRRCSRQSCCSKPAACAYPAEAQEVCQPDCFF